MTPPSHSRSCGISTSFLTRRACAPVLASSCHSVFPQGRHLRGLNANLTLYWNVMPIVGRLSTGHHTFEGALSLPDEYSRNGRG